MKFQDGDLKPTTGWMMVVGRLNKNGEWLRKIELKRIKNCILDDEIVLRTIPWRIEAVTIFCKIG